MGGQLFRGVITKQMLQVLPDGCWIISGVSHGDGTPMMTEQVGSLESRAGLWERMRSKRVTGRILTVLHDKAALDAHTARWEMIRRKAERR